MSSCAAAVRMTTIRQLRGLREKGIEAASLTSSSASQASAAAVMDDILCSSSRSRSRQHGEASASGEGGEVKVEGTQRGVGEGRGGTYGLVGCKAAGGEEPLLVPLLCRRRSIQ